MGKIQKNFALVSLFPLPGFDLKFLARVYANDPEKPGRMNLQYLSK